jgi:hypothetical protein
MNVRRSSAAGPMAGMGLLLALLLLAAGCGSKSSPSSSPTPAASPTPATVEAQVKANWEKFFAAATPAADRIALLQKGPQFASVIEAQAKSPLAQGSSAKVTAVTVVSATKAKVTYSILLSGAVVLPDQKGQAVLDAGVWKVSAKSFQALLTLEGQSGAGSPSASPTP